MDTRFPEVEAALTYLHARLDEPLELSRLARYAGYSPFHFTRLFKEQVGLSPMYYLSVLRLQKAKDLLLTTGLSIRDIGMEVGQLSLGTFTTRFSQKVGISPARFRESEH